MHSINSLRQTLGLTSANQVRNRIDAIKDLLLAHIRRGPNNQILLTDEGAALLQQLQELHDSGLTMTEASDIVRSTTYKESHKPISVSSPSTPNATKPDETAVLLHTLRDEIVRLRRHVTALEQRLDIPPETDRDGASWWRALREEIDAP